MAAIHVPAGSSAIQNIRFKTHLQSIILDTHEAGSHF